MENRVRKIEIPCTRLPDTGRLGGVAGSSRSETEGERGKENHTRKSNENAAEDVCLSRRPSLAFKSERAFGRYTGRVVNCNTGTVSKIKIEMNPRYC
jgi:hypothetical protein